MLIWASISHASTAEVDSGEVDKLPKVALGVSATAGGRVSSAIQTIPWPQGRGAVQVSDDTPLRIWEDTQEFYSVAPVQN